MHDNFTNNKERRLTETVNNFPQFKVVKFLGCGRFGEAYLLEDGTVLKITIDQSEYLTAQVLNNKILQSIVNIFNCHTFKCVYTDGESVNLYCIHQEYLDTISKKEIIVDFIKLFRHAWFSIYFNGTDGRIWDATFEDLEEHMANPDKYQKAIALTKNYILINMTKSSQKHILSKMYDDLVLAYKNIKENVPSAHIDLNDGNIGFTDNEQLKVFDIR